MTRRSFIDRAGTLIGLIVVAIVFGVAVGAQFYAPGNLELMARQAAIVCVAAIGMTVVIAAGGIDLSVGSMIALTTVAIALALKAGMGPGAAALAGIGAAALCGLVNGILITQLKVVPFIVTLGTMLICAARPRGWPKSAGSRRRSRG